MTTYNYWCNNCTCERSLQEQKFTFESNTDSISKQQKEKIHCPYNESEMKVMGVKTATTHIDKSKHKKGRTPQEKKERRIKDFRKNILPTIGGWERKKFEKQYGKPL